DGRHREIPPNARRHCLALAPSFVLVGELLISSWLSDGSVIGRSSTDQSPLLTTHQNFVAWESGMASMTLNPSFGFEPRWLVTVLVVGAWRTRMLRSSVRLTWFELPSGSSQLPTTSIRSPSFSVPFSSCGPVPGTWIARRLPFS